MKRIATSKLIAGLLGLASATYAWQVKNPPLPEPYHTPAASNRPQVIARPEGVKLSLPKGFSIDVYAEGFERPRFMLAGPSQEILLSDSAEHGGVWVLQDKDRDFKGETKKKILEGLDRPFGLGFWKDYLYVAETTSLKRYKYDAKAMQVDGKGQELVSWKDFSKGHWTRSILFDAKGEKMYLTVGSGSNVDGGEDPQRASIHRYNPDGSGHEFVASGVRNVIGLRWYPDTQALWAAVQERDGLGDELVPDYFTSIKTGGFYGWPYAYIGPNEDPRRKGEKPDLVKKTIAPDVQLGAHVAVLDALFYTGKQFPKEYRGGAFLAFLVRGTSRRVGYSVAFIPFNNGKPRSGLKEFLTDSCWRLRRGKSGSPSGLLQLPDGSLLVSDDGGNKIWRISYKP
jgi:glucose/arabinose dehydrogenase